MLNKLPEEDFAALRGPLESGRQSPRTLGRMLFLSIFLHAFLFSLEYFVAGDVTNYPNKERVLVIHFWVVFILAVLSLVYAIPAVYKRSQRIQYLVSILVSQNLFGVSFYIMALFLIASEEAGMNEASILTFTYITLTFGALIFIATCVRFCILLHKGHYRKGSKRDKLREGVEAQIKSHLPTIIVASMGLVFVIQYLVRTFNTVDINMITVIMVGFLIIYAMLFVLPEQLVILYCKHRFESFNFYLNGILKPMDQTKQKDVSL